MSFKTTLPLLAISFGILISCNTSKQAWDNLPKGEQIVGFLPQDVELLHTVYLIGDAGYAANQPAAVKALAGELNNASDTDAVIFLGDNIYPNGLPSENDPKRKEAESELISQLSIVKDFSGKTIVVPGNHDWAKGGPEGLKAIKRQQKFVENYLGKKDVFVPENGCGDPDKEKLSDDVVVIAIDSQWWIQNWDGTPGMNGGCEVRDRLEFLEEIDELLAKNDKKQVILVMHHPLFSNGNHGGYFSLKQHIFPLTDALKGAYVPLPVVGSIYPTYRSLTGHEQDLANKRYKRLKLELLDAVKDYENVIFAAGHEHSLQYFEEAGNHFIVSGAGSKNTYVRKGKGAEFVSSNLGYSKLSIYKNGEVWLSFYHVSPNNDSVLAYQQQIVEKRKVSAQSVNLEFDNPSSFADSIKVVANEDYAKNKRTFWLGEHYREAWGTEVTVPILNLEEVYGGLTVIKRGGGMSTNSLRLENEGGKQYVLRTINKTVDRALPEFAQNSFAIDISQDQISAIHPYSSVVIPKMASAVGIYHTNPKIVYLPQQKNLGTYNQEFGNQLYLFEERPAKNRDDVNSFGNSESIISYRDLLVKLREDNDDKIDQAWTLKSRLFDIFIHDWDRHDDQWRWAKFNNGKKSVYRPIPRDRDQAFYKFEGFLPWLASRSWAIPKFQTFEEEIANVKGWNFNARYFDRYFLTELDRDVWLSTVEELENALTDEVIEDAINTWPKELFDLNGPEIIRVLKDRRGNLKKMAMDHYEFISEDVNVLGTDKKEVFQITYLENGMVQVSVFKKDGETQLYQRTFEPKITKEIRLYGLDGDDKFIIDGNHSTPIKIRIIGGRDDDSVMKTATKNKVLVYDNEGGINMDGNGISNKVSNTFDINEYDRQEFKYNAFIPAINIASNKDDGALLGLGGTITSQGFRSAPYLARYKFSGNVSPTTGAFNLFGSADWLNLFSKGSGIEAVADLRSPEYRNWYGNYGNGAVFNDALDKEFYWTRLKNYQGKLLFKHVSPHESRTFTFGPVFQQTEIDNSFTGRIPLNNVLSAIPRNQYLGGEANLNVDARDSKALPTQGAFFHADFKHMQKLGGNNSSFRNANANLNVYYNIGNDSKTVLALRLGGGFTNGNAEYFHNQTLGTNTYLRGFRRDRFIGNKAVYQNLDLRRQLFFWRNKVIPGDVGFVLGADNGRVWYPGQNLDEWKTSITGGLYVSPYNLGVITGGYSKPLDEVGQVMVQVGFFF